MRVRTLALAAALSCAVAAPAAAHTRSQSFSTWRVEGERVHGVWSLMAREVTRLPEAATGAPLEGLFARHLDETLRVSRGGRPCPAEFPARPLRASPGHVRVETAFRCAGDGPIELEDGALFDFAPSHVHFARVASERGSVEHLLTDSRRVAVLQSDATPPGGDREADRDAERGAGFPSYLRLGVEHIVGGPDHVAFLLSLLLLGGLLSDVLWVVTGFTLGHSLTLSLAVLGWVRVDAGLVEALIGFSIALVAAENLAVHGGDHAGLARVAGAVLAGLALLAAWGGIGPPWLALVGLALFTFCYLQLSDTATSARRFRPAVTVLFGLVHGFGFASVLMEVGMPAGRLAAGLLGFNLGVEVGQIGLVASALAVAAMVRAVLPRLDAALAADVLSSALCALGLFWFVTRGWS